MISRFFNWILTLLAGRTSRGDQRLYLIAFMRGKFEGEWTLQFVTEKKRFQVFRFSWAFFHNLCGISLSRDGEGGHLKFHLAFPGFSFWLSTPIRLSMESWAKWNEKYEGYSGSHEYETFYFFNLRIFDTALWWEFLKFDGGWSSKMPKWMSGNFHLLDFLFGRMESKVEVVGTHNVVIPMPEGAYPAIVRLEKRSWKRPRLPWGSAKRNAGDVKIEQGIPHEAKGENSWDCGKDALYGLYTTASTVEEAVAATVKTVLESRRKYDGDSMAAYPAPKPPPTPASDHQLALEFGG